MTSSNILPIVAGCLTACEGLSIADANALTPWHGVIKLLETVIFVIFDLQMKKYNNKCSDWKYIELQYLLQKFSAIIIFYGVLDIFTWHSCSHTHPISAECDDLQRGGGEAAVPGTPAIWLK